MDHHATVEDTIVFPAWKEVVVQRRWMRLAPSLRRLKSSSLAMTDSKLRRSESEIESLGLANLGMFTAHRPRRINDMTNMKKFYLPSFCLFFASFLRSRLRRKRLKRTRLFQLRR
jgi:hypothetical protein